MLWKCIVSESNHCEIDWQRSSTRDLHNTIIHLAGRGRPWITGTGVCSNSIESATNTSRKFALAWHGLLFVSSVCWSVHEGTFYIYRLENRWYGRKPIRSDTIIQVYTTADTDTDTNTPCGEVSQPLISLDQAGCLENTAYTQWVAHSIQG